MNIYISKKVVIIIVIIFFIIPSLSLAQISTVQNKIIDLNHNYEVEYCIKFSEKDLLFDTLMGYDIVHLIEGFCTNDIGKPMMPAKEIKIALPAGMTVEDVRVVNFETIDITGEYNIFPAQPPRKTDGSDDKIEFVEPDIAVYTSNQPYPSQIVEFIHQSDLAGQNIANIKIDPVQYFPSEKKLMLHTSISFIITGVDGHICGDYLPENMPESKIKVYEQMINDMVINPEDVILNKKPNTATLRELFSEPINSPSIPPPLPDEGPYDHIIITTPYNAEEFQRLADWHTKRGLRDTVITTSWIEDRYPGTELTQKIRNFIIDAHNNWNTMYFLLGGEHPVIPFEYRAPAIQDPSDPIDPSPSDQYYSDFDDDWIHEVFVGRLSVENFFEIVPVVNKILMYEKNPPLDDYLENILLIGMDYEFGDPDTATEFLKDNISNTYIPSRFDVTEVYDSDSTNHKELILQALNEGQHLVNHCDHSNYISLGTGWRNHQWSITNIDVDDLENLGKTSIIVSTGCKANGMDDPDDEVPYNDDCIAEHFVIHNPNQAGIAFVGNTRAGYYSITDLYTLTNMLDYEWWKALFEGHKVTLGETLVECKHNYNEGVGGSSQHCEWTFNLLGEPAMPIWLDTPRNFNITHPESLPLGSSEFTVHVEDVEGENVRDAYVCLWKDDEVYLTGYTNGLGNVSFTPSPATIGTMYVTVTKHGYFLIEPGETEQYEYVNYLPYESSAEIIETVSVVLDIDSTPEQGFQVDVLPPDNNGDSTGETPFCRIYNIGTDITLTAPMYTDTMAFERWIINGVDWSYNQNELILVVEENALLIAKYVLLGDMDGNDILNAYDIDGFILALSDPEGYEGQYPGLDRVKRGDCNCDGALDSYDIDAFIQLITG